MSEHMKREKAGPNILRKEESEVKQASDKTKDKRQYQSQAQQQQVNT